MSNRTKIIIGLTLLFLLTLGGIVWWYISGTKTTITPSTNNAFSFRNFFPFGNSVPSQNNLPNSTSTNAVVDDNNQPVAAGEQPRLRRLSDEPVAASDIFLVKINKDILVPFVATSTPTTKKTSASVTKSTSTNATASSTSSSTSSTLLATIEQPHLITKTISTSTPFVRYTEKATGHVFEVDLEKTTQARISNTTVPKLYEGLFGQKDAILYRYINSGGSLETFVGTIVRANPTSTATSTTTSTSTVIIVDGSTEGKITGSFLPQNVYRVALAPTKDRIAYIVRSPLASTLFVANTDGSKATQITTSPLRELQLSFPTPTTVLLTTSPESNVAGYSFTANITNKKTAQILSNINGLTTLANKDLSYVAYSQSVGGASILRFYRTKDGQDTQASFGTLQKSVLGQQQPLFTAPFHMYYQIQHILKVGIEETLHLMMIFGKLTL